MIENVIKIPYDFSNPNVDPDNRIRLSAKMTSIISRLLQPINMRSHGDKVIQQRTLKSVSILKSINLLP